MIERYFSFFFFRSGVNITLPSLHVWTREIKTPYLRAYSESFEPFIWLYYDLYAKKSWLLQGGIAFHNHMLIFFLVKDVMTYMKDKN